MLYSYFSIFLKKLRSISCISLTIISLAHADTSADVQRILDGVNHFRMKHLLMPLKLNTELSQIAAGHSIDMARHTCEFGHSGWNQRFNRIHRDIPNTLQAGENVAYGYKDIDSVVNGWIHSPGHRLNILGAYNITGIAIAYDERHRPYYTQIFAKQASHPIRIQPNVQRHQSARVVHSHPGAMIHSIGQQLAKLF
jgi:uncharacterized protein YkwD